MAQDKFDAERYRVTIQKTIEDGKATFVARVGELPDVEVFAESFDAARAQALEVIQGLHAWHVENDKAFPKPSDGGHDASGRVTLRLARSHHARAIEYADADGVSLNTWISNAVVEAIGARKAKSVAEDVAKAAPFLASVHTILSAGVSTALVANVESAPPPARVTRGRWRNLKPKANTVRANVGASSVAFANA